LFFLSGKGFVLVLVGSQGVASDVMLMYLLNERNQLG